MRPLGFRLADLRALDEGLSAEEASFLRTHGASCAACREEDAFFGDMGRLVERSPLRSGPAPRRDVAAEAPARRHVPRRHWVALAAAALAIAATLALFARTRSVTPPPTTRMAEPTALGEGATLGAPERATCTELDRTVRVCVLAGGLARVTSAGPDRRLERVTGKLVADLDPQAPGTSFGVTTRDGSAIAIGTAFSVEVPPNDGAVVTRVVHGVVVFRRRTGGEQRVEAHESASNEATGARRMEREEESNELALARKAAATGHLLPVPVPVPGPGPDPDPGPDPGPDPDPDPGPDPDPDPVPRIAAGRAPSSAVVAPPSGSAATGLLKTARERRAQGDVDGARAAYIELFTTHAGTPEAHAALVPYGEFELSLGAANVALGAFERYIARGGALEEEARFGRIRALRALGRTAEERDELETFTRRFPSGALTPSLRGRLDELTAARAPR